jgi:hypothetical protein
MSVQFLRIFEANFPKHLQNKEWLKYARDKKYLANIKGVYVSTGGTVIIQ